MRLIQADRTAATRKALLGAARQLFATRGYAETSTDAVVQHAGVTRGALYHHFADKRDLFRAVLEQIEEEIDHSVRDATHGGRDVLERIGLGFDAFLDACMRPDVQRILLMDGPSVLGWEEWHAIDARYALAQIEASLRALVDAGFTLPTATEPLAHLLHGATLEAALYVATAGDADTAKAEIGTGLRRLFLVMTQPEDT